MTDLLTGHEPEPTNQEMVCCVQDEIKMREHVYPRLVASGKMKQAKADYQIRVMKAVLKLVEGS